MTIRNFLLKKGDQLAFTITFQQPLDISDIEWGIKDNFSDPNFKFLFSLEMAERNVIFIGDSYLEGYSPDGNTKSWGVLTKEMLPMNTYTIRYKGGTGFALVNQSHDENFLTLLDSVPNSTDITDVVVCGGYNDRYCSTDDILKAINKFNVLSKSKFPNATVKIGMVGWSLITSQQPSLNNTINAYRQGCLNTGAIYLNDVENSVHDSKFISSDKIHPNQEGQQQIANNLIQYLPIVYKGNIVKLSDTTYYFTLPSEITNTLDLKKYVYDIRAKVGNNYITPLSGKLIIKDSVFNG